MSIQKFTTKQSPDAAKYGKRGAKLSEGTKTRAPVPLDEAEKVFARLVAEKRGKGYTEDNAGIPFDGDASKLADVLPHPRKEIVSLAEAQKWSAADYLTPRKYDGELAKIEVAGAVILVEAMRGEISGHFYTAADRAMFARHPSGWFAAITVAEVHGENVLGRSTRERWGILCSYASQFPANVILAEIVTDPASALAAGAEGVCAHAWGDSWGPMLCHKANAIYVCRVAGTGNTQSVAIVDAETGEARGNVKLGGGKVDQVRVGSIIRVEGMGLTDKGLIRQPVACREWLVKL